MSKLCVLFLITVLFWQVISYGQFKWQLTTHANYMSCTTTTAAAVATTTTTTTTTTTVLYLYSRSSTRKSDYISFHLSLQLKSCCNCNRDLVHRRPSLRLIPQFSCSSKDWPAVTSQSSTMTSDWPAVRTMTSLMTWGRLVVERALLVVPAIDRCRSCDWDHIVSGNIYSSLFTI